MIRLEITDPTMGKTYVPHLSDSMNFEIITENPLFYKRGGYTLDIDISLKDPENRAIYNHIDRITSVDRPKGRKARLLCDGRVVCDGTEMLLSWTKDEVKIQIVAGSSELNYLIADDDLRVRDMNLGVIPQETASVVSGNLKKCYPDVNYNYPLFKDEEGERINFFEWNSGSSSFVLVEGNMQPIPFVLHIIDKFIEALGFKVKSNALASDPRWKRLIMPHNHETRELAKMLPDWSALEFLGYIESFFNCVFYADPITKEVNIECYQGYLENAATKEIKDDVVLDMKEVKLEEDKSAIHYYENLAYALPSGEYWKYKSLDETVIKICEQVNATFAQVDNMDPEDCEWKIFKNTDYGFQFIKTSDLCPHPYGEEYATPMRYIVNQFAPHVETRNETVNELKIIPARTEMALFSGWAIIMPVVDVIDKKTELEFKEAVKSGYSEDATDIMQVAFYSFEGNGFGRGTGGAFYRLNYPLINCVTARDYMDEDYNNHIHLPTYIGREDLTLELNGEYGLYENHFKSELVSNLEDSYTIYFNSKEILDPTSKFLIHGRLFVCQQLKYTYANGHQDPIVEGIFYPYI